MKHITSVLAVLAMLATPAFGSVTKVTDLIEERAAAELADVLPVKGRIDVRLATGMVQEGAFIQEFWIDPETGQFIANIVTDQGEIRRVWGLAVMTVEVPVPTRRLMPDDIVHEADLSFVEFPIQRLNAFAIQDAEDLVGQQVRRVLVAGRPVPRQSVMPPLIIERGDKVRIILNHGALTLTANGRAMSDAHKGQPIRVVNLSSNKAINAVARSAGVVEVDQ